jgi:hypothetical protein
MRIRILLLALSSGIVVGNAARAASYTNVFPQGYTAIANHLDRTNANHDTNLVGVILRLPPDGLTVQKWYGSSYDLFANRWDSDFGWDSPDMVIAPGEGAFLYNPSSTPYTNAFLGTAHVPVLPVDLVPGRYYFLSDQTLQVGSYESIVGMSPVEGSTVYLYTNQANLTNFSTWDVHTFSQGAWHPSPPTIPIGSAAFFKIQTNVPALAARPTISQPAVAGDRFRFTFNAESNRTYSVEFRSMQSEGSWSVLTNIPIQPAATDIPVEDLITTEDRSYRVRTP